MAAEILFLALSGQETKDNSKRESKAEFVRKYLENCEAMLEKDFIPFIVKIKILRNKAYPRFFDC